METTIGCIIILFVPVIRFCLVYAYSIVPFEDLKAKLNQIYMYMGSASFYNENLELNPLKT